MPLLQPLPEPVGFEEVAAILDDAVLQARGGPPYVIGADRQCGRSRQLHFDTGGEHEAA